MLRSRRLSEALRPALETLLNSTALTRSTILIADTADQSVRPLLDEVPFAAWPKVGQVDLDWTPGRILTGGERRNALVGGLGLVALDASRLAYPRADPGPGVRPFRA
jgi:hypothetical protein